MEPYIVEFNTLLLLCLEHQITDVHFNVTSHTSEISLRRHKRFIKHFHSPDTLALYRYLKFNAHFDVTASAAQTGVFPWYIEDKVYYCRFAAMESYSNKNGVLRILNMHHVTSIDDVIPVRNQQTEIISLMQERAGLVLFVGRTGSGKSTTMFHTLASLQSRHVYGLENPIERFNERWIQMEMKNLEEGLIQILRHDPDIVMIGEIRTKEELSATVRAGLSGHFLVATMHAGSIKQAIRRLLEQGVSFYDLKDILVGVVYQEMHENQREDVEIKYVIASKESLAQTMDELSREAKL